MENETKQALETIKEMNDEAYGYFISGLRIAIKAAGYKYEKDFAEGIMNAVTLSNNLTGKYRMRDDNIEKCAKKLNKDESEIVLIGKKSAESFNYQDQLPLQTALNIPGVDAKHVNPMDVIDAVSRAGEALGAASSAVQTLVRQHQKLDERMRYWKAIFENLPVPAMVIKNGIVVSQNTRSRALDIFIGKPFCENCAGDECDNKEVCPVNIAGTTARPASGYKIIKDSLYKLDVEFIRQNDHEYLIVLATESKSDAVPFNRRTGDRRKVEEKSKTNG